MSAVREFTVTGTLPGADEIDGYVSDRPEGDASRALRMLVALSGDVNDVHFVVIPGDPPSKARPKFGRGRAYMGTAARAAERATAAHLRRLAPEPMTGNVALACIFFRPNRQRIDVDNMLKHICDSGNGLLWHDDSQVTSLLGVVELDAERPRTLVAIAPHSSSLARGTDDQLPCENCGEPVYRRGGRAVRFCSRDCRAAAIRGRNKARAIDRPMSCCLGCGKELTHRRGGRCRDCWKANPNPSVTDAGEYLS